MSSAGVDAGPELVRELYGRYKRLTLAAAAELIAGSPTSSDLAEEVHVLHAESTRWASENSASAMRAQLAACAAATAELVRLVAPRDADDAAAVDEQVGRVRGSHSRLRREVWRVIPCEYVPCNAGAALQREE